MLKQRLLTAAILIPIFVLLVLYAPTFVFALGLSAIILLAAHEWSNLTGHSRERQLVFLGVLSSALLVAYFLASKNSFVNGFLTFAVLWWIGIAIWLAFHRKNLEKSDYGWFKRRSLLTDTIGVIVLLPPFLGLVVLHQSPGGAQYVLFLVSMIWAADSGAYFAGKRWGHRKLAPALSPGKSWEGVAGGIAAALLWSVVALTWLPDPPSTFFILLLAAVTVLISIVGDLFESVAKRLAEVKDSGTILPGHGGVFDRIDSLNAAVPIFVFGLFGVTAGGVV